MSRFIWLASYPKSGNTWVRAFLESVRHDGAAIDINRLSRVVQPAARSMLDELFGVPSSDLTPEEVLQARPGALQHYPSQAGEPSLHKVHDACLYLPDGQCLFPPALTLASVYIVRDPRDVAVSFAHHFGKTVDEAIATLADPNAALGASTHRLPYITLQPLLSWSQHVASWLDQAKPAALLVRYEDMLADPLAQGERIARHIGLDKPAAVYARAVRHSSFDVLRAQEAQHGFREVLAPERQFFRRGQAGAWRHSLSLAQASRIEADHHAMMQRLGYL